MAAGHEGSGDSTPQYGVGDELRMRRESMGKSIRDIVDAVRIQYRYLEALEDGRLEDLPGTVYALGFVRTYAEYLGLDGPEMVARYKEETEGLKAQNYVMPEPLEEGKVPTAAILLVAIVLAAAVYGAWYFFSQRDGGMVQEVPEVPERLSALTEESGTPAVPAAPPSEEIAETAPAPAAALPGAAPAVSEDNGPPPVEEPAPAATAPPPAESITGAPAETAAAQPVVETTAAPPPEPEEAAPVPAQAAPEAPDPASPPGEVAVAPPRAPDAEAPAVITAELPSAPEEPREPRVYGLGNANPRIVIIAEEDAWLEVTDADDARLFSRVLRKGDSYRAPNREGAKFVTGNAGGLKVVVDGEAAPALGPTGQVRRDVKLDPDLLKAGQAWP
jgi:cytoskeleton protein RodZ